MAELLLKSLVIMGAMAASVLAGIWIEKALGGKGEYLQALRALHAANAEGTCPTCQLEIDFSYTNLPREAVVEWTRLPSGKIVAITEEPEGYPESFWFEADGTSPKGSYLVPWPPSCSIAKRTCPQCPSAEAWESEELRLIREAFEEEE